MKDWEKEKNFVSAVVYVHDDAVRLPAFLHMLFGVLEENFLHAEIICVEDASEDDSAAVIRQVGKEREGAQSVSLSLLTLASFHGVEGAMAAGVELAIGDFVFEFDSVTFDFTPETVLAVYRKALTGFDIVSAVPTGARAFSSRAFYFFFRRFARGDFGETLDTERFRILSRRAINRVAGMARAVLYRKAAYLASGFPRAKVSYTPQATRPAPVSSRQRRYRERLAVDALLLFTDAGYRVGAGLTVFMMPFAVLFACYAVAVYLTGSPVAGWTTTVCFLSFAFFALFGLLTLVMKYLQLILSLVFRKEQINFAGIEKLTK